VVLLSFCLEFRVFKIAETRVLPIAQILTLDNWIHFVQFFCAPCRGNGPGPESGSGEVLRPVHPYLLLARVDRKFRDKKVLGLIGRHQQAGILSGGVMPPRWRGRRQGDVIAPVAQYPVGRPGPGTGQAQAIASAVAPTTAIFTCMPGLLLCFSHGLLPGVAHRTSIYEKFLCAGHCEDAMNRAFRPSNTHFNAHNH
jgi:hypothetical protein